jgi:tetratricopeptide (TPR) repeat protein
MLRDRYGNALSTASTAARDAYVEGCDKFFAVWPGFAEAFARATTEDPGFALAHLGTAQAAAARNDIEAMKAALSAAQRAGTTLVGREASHLAFFNLLLTGQSAAALEAARRHLDEWPRDAVVMNYYGPILGLISTSGCPGSKRMQAEVMDAFAPQYGDDWWYQAHHAMALSEVGRHDEALTLAERSFSANPRNGFAAHSRAHVAYEAGEPDGGRSFLTTWLPTYPREGLLYSHLVWHLAIAELAAGNDDTAFRLYEDAVAPEVHTGLPRMRAYEPVQFLWRWELAGHPRDAQRWKSIDTFAHDWLPRAGQSFPDMHVALADAIAGDETSLQARLEQMEELERAGRYPEGGVVPVVSRGLAAYARGDYAGAITQLTPLLDQTERLGGGSRAQFDIVDFTVMRACALLGRHDELARLLATRRSGPLKPRVAGMH